MEMYAPGHLGARGNFAGKEKGAAAVTATREVVLTGCVRPALGEQAADGGGFRDAPDGENISCVAHVRVVFAAGFVHVGK
jgi:hypothetical protein